jgi:hypothetical protein
MDTPVAGGGAVTEMVVGAPGFEHWDLLRVKQAL